MAGAVLLLVLGTQVLDWPWLAALAAASLAAGLFRFRDGLSSDYAMARRIDRRMDLHDGLSTALFYQRYAAGRRASDEVRDAQRAQAERSAAQVSVVAAVPFTVPRSLYGLALLALVASSLFAFRYAISRSLDLHPPLISLVIDAFHLAPARLPEHPLKKKQDARRRLPKGLEEFGVTPEDETGAATQNRNGAEGPSSDSKQPGAGARGQGTKTSTDQASVENLTEQQRAAAEQRDGSGEEAAGSSRPGAEQPRDGGGSEREQASGSRRSSGEPNESDSLVDRFRDAMANLLSRLKPQPDSGQGRSLASNSGERRQSGTGRESGRNGSQAANRNAAGSRSSEGQGDQQGEGAQQAQRGPGKSGAGKDEASRQGQSGIGSEDGDKEIRAAEQLAALGKISEIIGRRSQNLSGDMTVEVASGPQQLKTPYTHQGASHAEAGGEVHRDEIPFAYQRYVEQYFDEVRKPATRKPQQ